MLNSPVEEIKNRLDIVEVIGSYLKLQKAGANHRALCPFHTEKTPSFFVSPSRQIWHCFGACGEGGDIFKFIMKIEGVEFGDALRLLAQKAGVTLKRQDPRMITERQRLYRICELATKLFEKQLHESQPGREVKAYLLKRGITEEGMRKWRLGLAPDTWRGLTDFLKSRGCQEEEIIKAGLALRGENNVIRDRFRHRIIFPVFDFNGNPIGFGGRICEKPKAKSQKPKIEEAKYVNTPNTLLYDKSRLLYGLDKAKLAIRSRDACILVEGYTDVIMASQAGFENVVATSGTALTAFQLNLLKRYSKNLLLAFDMDLAGDSATKRGINLAQSQGFNLKVITMPQGKDPADIIASSPETWQKLVAEAKDITAFYFETTLRPFSDKTSFDPEDKVKIAEALLPAIRRLPNKILQAHWLGELAKKLQVKEEDLEVELRKHPLPELREREEELAASPPKKSRQEMLEERILTIILREPKCFKLLKEDSLAFFSPEKAAIIKRLKEANFGEVPQDPLALEGWEQETFDLLNYLALRADVEREAQGEQEGRGEINACLKNLKRLAVKGKLEEISQDIKAAEENHDSARINLLLEEFNKLAKELK